MMSSHNWSSERFLFLLLLCLSVIFVLSQRAFPTQDGPMHLYYADVFMDLLRGSGQYCGYYEIRHIAPPYALQTYLLAGLALAFGDLAAEKLLVCLYLVSFCCGFRYLARSVEPANNFVSLFAFPFALSWPLYVGLYNFCFGVAEAMLIAGYWLRHDASLRGWRCAGFFGLIIVTALTHPMPLTIAITFMIIHLGLQAVLDVRARAVWSWAEMIGAIRPYTWRAALVLIASTAVFWCASFAPHSRILWEPVSLRRVLLLVSGGGLTPFRNAIYLIILSSFTVAAAYLSWLRMSRACQRDANRSDLALALTAMICGAVFLFAPAQVMGAYFGDRLTILLVSLLSAFGAGVQLPKKAQTAAAIAAGILSCACIGYQVFQQRVVNECLTPVIEAEPAPPMLTAAVIAASPEVYKPNDSMFFPYLWAGAYYARKSRAVILNSPWLDASVMMLRPSAVVKRKCQFLNPFEMRGCLEWARANGIRSELPDVLISLDNPERPSERAANRQFAELLGMIALPIRSPVLTVYISRDKRAVPRS